jgi:ABC-type sugar transport system ATPase subunit
MSLRVEGFTKSYGGLAAVKGVDLEARAGAITAVIGPNGAGKTTLLNLISGVVIADAGRLLLGGKDVTGSRPHQLAGLGLTRTYQNPQLFTDMTVLDTVMVGAHRTGSGGVRVEALIPIGVDGVQICEEHQRHLRALADRLDHLQHLRRGRATADRTVSGQLIDDAIRQRIAERQAQLNDIRTRRFQRQHDVHRLVQGGVASGDVGHEGTLALGLELGKAGVESVSRGRHGDGHYGECRRNAIREVNTSKRRRRTKPIRFPSLDLRAGGSGEISRSVDAA